MEESSIELIDALYEYKTTKKVIIFLVEEIKWLY